jgi:hypothetical protein
MSKESGEDKKWEFTGAAREVAPILLGLFVALVGTDPFNARGRSHLLTLVNRLALGFWVATILLLLLPLVLPRAQERALSVRPIVTVASGGIAVLLTIAMFALFATKYGSDSDHFQVTLSGENRSALDALCKTYGKEIDGRIATGGLEGAFVVLHLDKQLSGRCDDVRIPVVSILALREIH